MFVHNHGNGSEYFRTILVGLGPEPSVDDLANATHSAISRLKALEQTDADVVLPVGASCLPVEQAAETVRSLLQGEIRSRASRRGSVGYCS